MRASISGGNVSKALPVASGAGAAAGAEEGGGGTLAYMAPEVLKGTTNKPASDVYSLGMLVFEGLTLTPPLGRVETFARAHHLVVKEGARPELEELEEMIEEEEDNALLGVLDVLRACWAAQWTKSGPRPTAAELHAQLATLVRSSS